MKISRNQSWTCGAIIGGLLLVAGLAVQWWWQPLSEDGLPVSESSAESMEARSTPVHVTRKPTLDVNTKSIGSGRGTTVANSAISSVKKATAKPFVIKRHLPDGGSDPVRDLGVMLKPRTPHPPQVLRLPPGTKHRIEIKFIDKLVARVTDENQVSLLPAVEKEVEKLVSLAGMNGLVFTRVFEFPERIEALRKKAAIRSQQMQADLNGTMFVHVSDPSKVLEVAQALQKSQLIESVDIASLDSPPPPPADIAPTTPSLVSLQTYHNTNPGFGVDYLKSLGATGAGVRFTDCEYAFNFNHEDLEDSGITDVSPAAINPSVYEYGYDDHGTAVMGVIGAGDNSYGVTGIAPDSAMYFSSEWTTQGYNRSASIAAAMSGSSAGDVILLEMQATGTFDYVPAEYISSVWNLTKTATDAGIIVVAAAGNGTQNLDGADYVSYMARGDSGAIIVGAGSKTTSHTIRYYSTYGARVNVHAWGEGVMTTGYGGYAKYGDDENQAYTSSFNGTSSASACAAGVVVLMQSYAKNVLGTLFTPEEMRSHLVAYGHAQGGSGGAIGPALSLDLAVAGLPDRPMTMTTGSNGTSLLYYGLPFRTYKIEASQNMDSWIDWMTGLSGSINAVPVDLSGEFSSYDARFYRISEEP